MMMSIKIFIRIGWIDKNDNTFIRILLNLLIRPNKHRRNESTKYPISRITDLFLTHQLVLPRVWNQTKPFIFGRFQVH